jgi:hypothetical protein
VILAVAGCCLPQPLFAAAPASGTPTVVDVKLQDGGVLYGQVVDSQGAPRANLPVAVLAADQQVAASKTGSDGTFAFRGLRGGVYQVTTPEGYGVCRVWAPLTAPPNAQNGVMLVAGQGLVRAQGLGGFISHPWVVAAIIGTAVAVPVAIHNADRDEPHSP